MPFLAAPEPQRTQRRDIGGEPDRETRENDVEDDREGELQAGEKYGIEVLLGPPASSFDERSLSVR
jgi:hypothetical protein